MHIAVVNESHQANRLGLKLGEYVIEDMNAAEFLYQDFCRLKEPIVPVRPFRATTDWNRRRILFVRPGGFGDLLFLTPIFAEIKSRWPEAVIHVACFPQYMPALSSNADVAQLIPYPVPMEDFKSYDGHVWLENIIEKNPDAEKVHVIDLLADRVGIDLSDKKMRYQLIPSEMTAALDRFPRTGKKRVGVQVRASSPVRTYPFRQTLEMCQKFMRRGWEVFLFGAPGSVHSDSGPGLVNLTQLMPSVNFRESVAILNTCDVVVAPDSALCHIAGILEKPTVALFGSFPWALRTAYAPSIYALSGNGRCAPCFHHGRKGEAFPFSGPCSVEGECTVLGSIEPQRIVAKAELLLVQ